MSKNRILYVLIGLFLTTSPNTGHVDEENSTNTALEANATFTGVAVDLQHYSSTVVALYGTPSTATGTLYMQFSVDGVNWDSSIPVTVTNPTSELPHTLVPTRRYFRIRYVNDSVAQTAFRLQVMHHTAKSKGLTLRIGNALQDNTDADAVKAVLVGKTPTGEYRNIAIGADDSLGISVQGSGATTSFGELAVAQPEARVTQLFHLIAHTGLVDQRANQSGTITRANNMIAVSTGAASSSGSEAISFSTIPFTPGQGCLVRFNAMFTTGVTGSTQYVGAGNARNGFFFGYKNSEFGVCRRRGGLPEVRTLTVTTKSTTAENITITLDGVAKTDVAVTNATAGNTTTTANDIAAADYSSVGAGWTARASGSTVLFTSWNSASHSGTYSLSNASTAVGSFAQTLAGTAATDTFVTQTSWNNDTFNGSGASGITLDPTKLNGYQIRYEWSGSTIYSIENPSTGNYDICHVEEYGNTNTVPSVTNPTLPLYIGAKNTSNTSSLTIRAPSLGGFIEGKGDPFGVLRGVFSTKSSITTTEIPVISIRNKIIYNSTINTAELKVKYISVSVEHTKPMVVRFYSNPVLTGAAFTALASNAIAEQDTSATAASGGTLLFALALSKTGSEFINLSSDIASAILRPGNILTVTAQATSGTGAEANVGMNIIEFL